VRPCRKLRQALGGADERVIADPARRRHPARYGDRRPYFGKLSTLGRPRALFPAGPGADPRGGGIWISFAKGEASGKVGRRRYIPLFTIGRGTMIGLVADADGREWSALTFFRGAKTGVQDLRQGFRVFSGNETRTNRSCPVVKPWPKGCGPALACGSTIICNRSPFQVGGVDWPSIAVERELGPNISIDLAFTTVDKPYFVRSIYY
jgi:hypothetical protein